MADINLAEELRRLQSDLTTAVEAKDAAATARINEHFDEINTKMRAVEALANRPAASGVDGKDAEAKAAFAGYLRSRSNEASAELKAMTAGSPTDGGTTVPKVIQDFVQKRLVDISPVRSVARVISIGTPDYRIPFSVGGTAATWSGETDARPDTATSKLVEIVPALGEMTARPKCSQQLLEDSQFDIAAHIAAEAAIEFARAEGASFVSGNGTNQPKGFTSVTLSNVSDKTRAYGTVQFVPSVATITADALIVLVHSLKAGFRANAKFAMTKATKGVIRSLKDDYGQYLLVTSLVAGTPDMLLGYPVVEMEDLPEFATNAYPVWFGDFASYYTITDRVGISTLFDPYSFDPLVCWKWRKRVGGNVVDTEAVKALKIVAS